MTPLGGRCLAPVLGRAQTPPMPVATYTVTTTGGETHTINELGVAPGASCRIDWGDGTQDTYTGNAKRTHLYPGAGVWTVTVYTPEAVRTFDMRDGKVTLRSVGIRSLRGVTTFLLTGVKGGRFDSADVRDWRPVTFTLIIATPGFAGHFASADVSAWRPSVFYVASLPAGYTGAFHSADLSAWRPITFRLQALPIGFTGVFASTDVSAWHPTYFFLIQMPVDFSVVVNSADLSTWRPTYFYLGNIPGASVTADGGFAAWTTTTYISLPSAGLTQATVDAVLWEVYQATRLRPAAGVMLDVSGANAAPSGVHRAAQACPVTVSTPGKEIAHELRYDGCGAGLKKWGSVTFAV